MKITKLIEQLIAIKMVEGDVLVKYIDCDSVLTDVDEVEVIRPKWKSGVIRHSHDKYVELY